MTRLKVLLAAFLTLTVSQAAIADVFSIDPAGAFLHTNSDPATNPRILDLSALTFAVHDGDILHLASQGFFYPGTGAVEDSESMLGVFSSTNTLLASSNLNRVPGALAAGTPFVTATTFNGSQPTDIPQDFLIDSGGAHTAVTPAFSSVNVQVPVGAHFLFVSSYDNFYSTNTDANGDFKLAITLVPEPASLAVLALGAAALLARRRR